MIDQPLVSVMIPVYNGEQYIGEAIESILQQRDCPCEVIVVDDGSTDGSAQVVRQFGRAVRYHYQTHRNIAEARNQGIALAQGDFLAFLDADDLWVENKLAWQMQVLQQDSALAMVFGQVEQFYSPELTGELPALGNRQTIAGVHAGSILIRRADFLRVGLFNPAWSAVDFLEWYGRAQLLKLPGYTLPKIVTKRRIHRNNMSIREQATVRSEYLRLMKYKLDQRRQVTLSL